MKTMSPIVRITLGLLFIMVSLLLVSEFIGLIPDKQRSLFEARKTIAQTLAIQVSIDVSHGHLSEAEQAMTLLHKAQNIESIGLRQINGELLFSVGDHLTDWVRPKAGHSTYSHLLLPIYQSSGHWGTLEVRFQSEQSLMGEVFDGQTILGVILFVSIAGYFSYWLFLKRALRELDPAAVIPDRVKTALNALSDGLVILDPQGQMLFANASFCHESKQQLENLIGKPLSSLAWDTEHASFVSHSMLPWNKLLNKQRDVGITPLKLVLADQSRLSFSVKTTRIDDAQGQLQGVIVALSDHTKLEQSHEELKLVLVELELSKVEITVQNKALKKLASYDPLTGILNRRALFERLEALIAQSLRSEQAYSCLMVDIDHFKRINDTYGHAIGDIAIKAMSDTLMEMTRPEDLVGRYGGEEFVVVLKGAEPEKALEIAERIRVAVSEIEIDAEGDTLTFTASFGVTTDATASVSPKDIVDQADQGLYAAKSGGRNKVVHFDAQHKSQAKIDAVQANEGVDPLILGAKKNSSKPNVVSTLRGDAVTPDTSVDVMELDIKSRLEQVKHEKGVAIVVVGSNTIEQAGIILGDHFANMLHARVYSILFQSLGLDQLSPDFHALQSQMSLHRLNRSQFVIIISEITSERDVSNITQGLTLVLKTTMTLAEQSVLVVPYFGASWTVDQQMSEKKLLSHALAAQLDAQHRNQESCAFYNAEFEQGLRLQLRLSSHLRKSLQHNGLFLEYLPQIDSKRGCVSGFEALVRWHHPDIGMVHHEDLVNIAEQSGINSDIAKWLLVTALKQLKQWQKLSKRNDLFVTVNFSLSQLHDLNSAHTILDIIKNSGLLSQHLSIDITESVKLQHRADALEVVTELHKAGVKIVLDGFGTERTSLASLKELSVDGIKIDRNVISNIGRHAIDTEIATSLINMAHRIGVKVIADGVVNKQQLSQLHQLHCYEVQGEYYSKALLKEQATTFLQSEIAIEKYIGGDKKEQVSGDISLTGVLNKYQESTHSLVT